MAIHMKTGGPSAREVALSGLTTRLLGRPCLRFEEIDSTNLYLKTHTELPSGTAVFTQNQTAGYGRRGRRWENGEGLLALSALW